MINTEITNAIKTELGNVLKILEEEKHYFWSLPKERHYSAVHAINRVKKKILASKYGKKIKNIN